LLQLHAALRTREQELLALTQAVRELSVQLDTLSKRLA
jgi:hypothetical protein